LTSLDLRNSQLPFAFWITPYWRTLKAGGELNPKFPGGLAVLRSRLQAEGHTVVARGQRLFVAEYTKRLVRPKAK